MQNLKKCVVMTRENNTFYLRSAKDFKTVDGVVTFHTDTKLYAYKFDSSCLPFNLETDVIDCSALEVIYIKEKGNR